MVYAQECIIERILTVVKLRIITKVIYDTSLTFVINLIWQATMQPLMCVVAL